MLLTESQSRLAVTVWALTWLPGLAVAAWRGAGLVRAGRLVQAAAEGLGILSVPMIAFWLYAVSDARRYAVARGVPIDVGYIGSVSQVAVPYAVSAAYLAWALRPGVVTRAEVRWWLGLVLGLLSVPLLVPGLFMAQLMVLLGGQ